MGQARRRREEARAAEPMPTGDGRVVIGYCHGENVRASFHETVVLLLIHDMRNDHRIVGGGGRSSEYSSANVSNARNSIVKRFLDNSTAEWLFMVDTDMSFPPETLDMLLAEAYRHGVPIVGGLCFGQNAGALFPTMYRIGGDAERPRMFRVTEWTESVEENPTHPLYPVTATGAACLLVHRSVFERMREVFPEPYPFFREEILGEPPWGTGEPGSGVPLGEDITFCMRAQSLGFPVFVHLGTEVGHDKSWILARGQYEDQRAIAAAVEAAAAEREE